MLGVCERRSIISVQRPTDRGSKRATVAVRMDLMIMLMSGLAVWGIASMNVTLRGCPGRDRDAHHNAVDWRDISACERPNPEYQDETTDLRLPQQPANGPDQLLRLPWLWQQRMQLNR